MTVWTVEMHARLCELASASEVMSYTVIAEKLSAEFGEHLTKNACIGRAGRFGIRKQAAPSFITPGYARPAKPKPERKAKMRVARFTVAPPRLTPKGPRGGRKTIMELAYRSCRWVYGEQPPYLFCGARTDSGCSYCTGHQAVVYNGNFKRRA